MGSRVVAEVTALRQPDGHVVPFDGLLPGITPFLDALSEPVICLDPMGQVLHQNPSFASSWVWPAGGRARLQRPVCMHTASTAVVRLKDHSANPSDVRLHLVAVRDEMGEPCLLIARAVDVGSSAVDQLRQAAALIMSRVSELDDRHSPPPRDADVVRRVADLSKREREILDLVLEGNRVTTVARRLYLSENTVRNYLKRIYHKLDVHSLGELRERLAPASTHLA